MKKGNFWVVHAGGSYNGRSFDDYAAAEQKASELRAKSVPFAMITKHSYELPLLFSGYTPSQTEVIQEAIIIAKADAIKMGGWQTCRYSSQIIFANQACYAVFDRVAYEMPKQGTAGDQETVFECLPVLINGHAFRIDPEDGSGGILMLIRCIKKLGQACATDWVATYNETSWAYLEELQATTY